MNSHDTYRYHRERLGYSHDAAKMIATGGIAYWTHFVSVSGGHGRRDRFRQVPTIRDRPTDTMRVRPASVLQTRALLRKKMPITDQQLDDYLAHLRDLPYVGTATETRRKAKLLVRSLNPRLRRESQLIEYNGWVARASQFVTTVGGRVVDIRHARQSILFPGGWTIGPRNKVSVTVSRRRLKARFIGLSEEEVIAAGFIPLRSALRGKHLTDEMIDIAYSRLRVGRTNYELSALYVDRSELAENPGMLDAERITLVRNARRVNYHHSGVGSMSPPSGANETYGFEWELVAGNGTTHQSLINKIDSIAVSKGVLLGYERDSSLQSLHEVEVVSSPHTLETHLQMLRALPDLTNYTDTYQTTARGGIHIHVGATAFQSRQCQVLFGLLFSYHKNWECERSGWAHIAGRGLNNYVRAVHPYSSYLDGFVEYGYHGDRYTAANHRSHTTEVRIFRSSARPEAVMRALRVVATAVAYANAILTERPGWMRDGCVSIEAITVERFAKWAHKYAQNTDEPERYMTREELEDWMPDLREAEGPADPVEATDTPDDSPPESSASEEDEARLWEMMA